MLKNLEPLVPINEFETNKFYSRVTEEWTQMLDNRLLISDECVTLLFTLSLVVVRRQECN